MSKNTIEITVKDKIATTDFSEVVSLNNNYRLNFHFDEEWKSYTDRVAVVKWENGSAEQLFQGSECDMPRVDSITSEYVQIGVYSILGGKRISSSFVTLRCMAGACAKPAAKPVDSLHEQILDYLNQHESVGGGKIEGALHIGEKSYDGSEDVTITGEDLGLAEVAISGSYNDLSDKPAAVVPPVTSVNGKTGAVQITKGDVGLGMLTNNRQMPIFDDVRDGADANTLTESGFYHVRGTSSAATKNMPSSTDNGPSNNRWCILVLNQKEDNLIVQIAISERADRAMYIRNCTAGSWNSWYTIV